MKNLNEKLASVLFDCHPKDDLGREQAELVQEANAGDFFYSTLHNFSIRGYSIC